MGGSREAWLHTNLRRGGVPGEEETLLDPAPASIQPLPAERLRWRCDPQTLGFESTDELSDLTELVGQERGIAAIAFGLGLAAHGYNLFVVGPTGSGRRVAVESLIAEHARARPTPSDWCYIHNFAGPD